MVSPPFFLALALPTAAALLRATAPATTPSSFPTYTEKFYNQTIDHFRYGEPTATYLQRYLFNDDHFGQAEDPLAGIPGAPGCKGPILFYSGNEGAIDGFWASNGFMVKVLAPKLGALLVFGEHRYYGKSMPFGQADSLSVENAVFLTTEQAMADYASLVLHIKATVPGAANCPVITFGGSYGGTLTTYLRAKYPSVFRKSTLIVHGS